MCERKTYKVDTTKVKKNDLMAFVYYAKVVSVSPTGESVRVQSLNDGIGEIVITGRELIENSHSADQSLEDVKVSKTRAAEILVGSPNRPLTVCFEKADGTERVLRGKLVKPEPLLGRSMMEDMDVDGKDRLRQVDHRTIQYIIVDGVKYVVK